MSAAGWIAAAACALALGAGLAGASWAAPWIAGTGVIASMAALLGSRRAPPVIVAPAAGPAPAPDALAMLRPVIGALPDPMLVTSAAGVVIAANGAAAAFFGLELTALVGRRLHDLFTRAEALAMLDAALAGGADTRTARRVRLAGPAGERTCDLSAALLRDRADGAGAAALVAIRDVTELAEASRVKTEFVANASHELRTPLAAIRAGLETLEGGARDDPRMVDRVHGMIASQATRLEDLVRDLLDLSRVESPTLPVRAEPLRVDELTQSLRAEFETVCRDRRLGLELALDRAIDGAATDQRLVALILRNLVENATKFAFEETTIRVRGAMDAGGALRFEVEDRGVGIPLAHQARVFERFHQVNEARSGGGAPAQRRGTGLGLAIVRHAARAMGGRVWLRSVLQEGTTVGVELPSPPKPGGAGEAAPERAAAVDIAAK